MILVSLAYGISTLVILWMGGGGDLALFASRIPVGIIILAVVVGTSYAAQKRLQELKPEAPSKPTLLWGLSSGLILTLASVVVFFILRSRFPAVPLADMTWVDVLLLALFFAPLTEIIHRGILLPVLGLSTVLFMEALSFGCALQSITVFALIYGGSYVLSQVHRRSGLGASILGRTFWTLLTLVFLKFLG